MCQRRPGDVYRTRRRHAQARAGDMAVYLATGRSYDTDSGRLPAGMSGA